MAMKGKYMNSQKPSRHKKNLQNNQTEMHIRVWDDIGLVLTRAASFVYVIRWKALMATWTPNQSYLETASVFGTKKIERNEGSAGT